MTLQDTIRNAIQDAIGDTLAAEIQEIVAKETRRAFLENEKQFTTIIRTSVRDAFSAMLTTDSGEQV